MWVIDVYSTASICTMYTAHTCMYIPAFCVIVSGEELVGRQPIPYDYVYIIIMSLFVVVAGATEVLHRV